MYNRMNFMIQKLFIIPEYPDYMIYPNGDVFSIRNNKILKVRYDKNGYKRLSLKNVFTNKLDTLKIHQLVGMCYLGYKKNSKFVVDHIDNNKQNNYLHNLQVITSEQNQRKENMKKKKLNGLPFYIHFTKFGYGIKFKTKGEQINLGECYSLEEAVKKRDEYFKELLKDVKM